MFAMFTLLPFNDININEALMFNTTPYLTLMLCYNTCRPIIIIVYLEFTYGITILQYCRGGLG